MILTADLDGLYMHCGVAELASSEAAVAAAVDGLDLVHLNPGVATGGGVEDDFDLDAYRRAMGINLDGVVFGAHGAIPALRAWGRGTIIATADMAGSVAVAGEPIYGAYKPWWVFLRSLAPARAGNSVAVQALCPSFAATALIAPLRSFIEGRVFPILAFEDVVDCFFQILDSDATGGCWFVVPGRPSEPFHFRSAPGPRA
ncbi:MAG: SDR family NAD(P)-dependent oxidoreductase [Actinomycetota bacterium]|nr:SDR family NAD(P)-dependent oxidoreductase [Actinomycetota bacterium]